MQLWPIQMLQDIVFVQLYVVATPRFSVVLTYLVFSFPGTKRDGAFNRYHWFEANTVEDDPSHRHYQRVNPLEELY